MKKNRILLSIIVLFLIQTAVFAQSSGNKPIVAVLDLQAVEVSESEARAVTNLLISVIHGTDLVQIIDRNQREEILNEISFSLSGCADDSCALEIGKMLAADILITGSLSKVGSRISIELKALSIEEGAILETTFKLYESVDEVVDNIDSVGATLIQNVTGKRAAQREVLEYEDLVTLTVTSETEDASVFINGTPIGRIENGRITKALNRNIDVVIRLEHPLYYTQENKLYLDSDQNIDMLMEPHYPVKSAIKISSGGGTMGSAYWRWYPIPNRLFLDFGLGTTVQNMDVFYMTELLSFKSGYYFNRENSFIRPYGGLSLMYPFFDWMVDDNFPGPISFFSSNPDDDNINATGGDSILEALDFGLLLGVDFVLTDNFYLGLESNLFLNTLFQTNNFSFLNMLIKPFSLSADPMFQFGISAVFLFPPPQLKNQTDIEGEAE